MRGTFARRASTALHRLDHAIGRLGRTRRVLVELRTPVYHAVLNPIFAAIEGLADVKVWFTSEYPERIHALVPPHQLLTHRQVEWMRFDLYVNADPWAAARLRRCARRINFFHGVAGKYDLDEPRHLPMGFQYYDRVGFINRDRMSRYLEARIVTPGQARLVGHPKLDRLASGHVDGAAIRAGLELEPHRPTALYAPTYSPSSSLHLAGEAIIHGLATSGFNVIVKLHDRSLDTDPRYNAGIDWRSRMYAAERRGQVRYVEGADVTPFLAAADVMVTDHSSAGFEYLILDRPLLIFDAPDLAVAARINPEKLALLRSAARVVRTAPELAVAATEELEQPALRSSARRQVAAAMFHEPGSATARAVTLAQELLATSADARDARQSVEQHVPGGAS
jgi:hypothetical protein